MSLRTTMRRFLRTSQVPTRTLGKTRAPGTLSGAATPTPLAIEVSVGWLKFICGITGFDTSNWEL